MSNFPTSTPILVKTGAVSISDSVATYRTLHGSIEFNVTENPIRFLDGEMRQVLMKSMDGDWFVVTNSGGISLLFVRLFHQIYLTKLPSNHEVIPSN